MPPKPAVRLKNIFYTDEHKNLHSTEINAGMNGVKTIIFLLCF